jgi:predicted metalloprotease with PDZ domain
MCRRALVLLPLLCALSCRDRAAGPAPAGSAPGQGDGLDGFTGLTLDLTPEAGHGGEGELLVDLRLSAPRAAALVSLAVARAWGGTHGAAALGAVRARDDLGDLPVEALPDDGGPDRVFRLARAPRGDLEVRYRARAPADAEESPFALRLHPDRVSGVGHAFLLLPRFDGSLPARIRWHTASLGRGADAASSFGFGADVTATATAEELAHAVYVAGKLWLERGAGGADERLVVLGDPPFDTRTALDFSVAAADAVGRVFDPRAPRGSFSFFLVAEPGLGSAEDGAYLTRSLGLWFDAARPLDAALRLVIAHELTHRFLGGAVRLVDPDGREATWFSEGFAVHFARKALFAAGLLAPADFLADLRRTVGESSASLPEGYRRGARWAAVLDGALLRSSKGARSLDDVVRALLARSRREAREALPVAALREALGAEAGAVFDRLAARPGEDADLPGDAFGPCFRRAVREARVFDLGFEREDLGRPAIVIRGLRPGSAAARAGVREGALVLSSKVPSEEAALGASAEVELLLTDGRGSRKVRYRPVTTTHEARWEAAACTR